MRGLGRWAMKRYSSIDSMPDSPFTRKLKEQLAASRPAEKVGESPTPEAKPKRKKMQPLKLNVAEELFAAQLRDAKIPMLQQFKFIPGRNFVADFADPGMNLIVEIDGGFFVQASADDPDKQGGSHSSIGGRLRDLERNNLAALHGWFVLRFHTEQVTKTGEALATVKEFYANRKLSGE
jgi:very-short-patch-repair endonuclease